MEEDREDRTWPHAGADAYNRDAKKATEHTLQSAASRADHAGPPRCLPTDTVRDHDGDHHARLPRPPRERDRTWHVGAVREGTFLRPGATYTARRPRTRSPAPTHRPPGERQRSAPAVPWPQRYQGRGEVSVKHQRNQGVVDPRSADGDGLVPTPLGCIDRRTGTAGSTRSRVTGSASTE